MLSHSFSKSLILVCCLIFTVHLTYSQQKTASKSGTTVKGKRVFYGQASFYANKFNGRKTANGEIFNQQKMTAACNLLPLGTWIRVTNLKNGKSVVVKINDRLHTRMRRLVDLSYSAAKKLDYIKRGLTRVKVEVINPKKKKKEKRSSD